MIVSEFEDLTTLWHGTVQAMLWSMPKQFIDLVTPSDAISFDNVLTARTMNYDFDLGLDLGFQKARWTKLVRDYLDLSKVTQFLERVDNLKQGGIAELTTRAVRSGEFKHYWGNCILGFTYRDGTLTMHSRVSYVAYIAGMDLALAHAIAREIGHPEVIRFRWVVDSLQFHGLKSIPYLLKHVPEFIQKVERKQHRRDCPTWRVVGNSWDSIVRSVESGSTSKFGPFRRVQQYYEDLLNEGHVFQKVPLRTLTLDPIRRYP